MAKNRIFLYGKNSVIERLRVNPGSIRQIFIQDNFRSPEIMGLIRSNGIPFYSLSEKDLLRKKQADRLQGIVAETSRYIYSNFDNLLNEGLKSNLCILFLDGLNDPHNLGSIMRTAACFGGFAIVIPEHGSCEVNETVIHVSSGGENYVRVAKVTNLASSLLKAKKAGYWAVGTVVEGGEDVNSTSIPFPLCLVLGAEGKGIRYGIQKHLDIKITIPMSGAHLSLNVAMTSAIICYEVSRQKQSL